jgi:uncharacterized protein (DUF1501 family)
MTTTRRRFIEMAGYGVGAATLPLGAMSSALAACSSGDKKIIMIYLRGGADAFNMVAPRTLPAADVSFYLNRDGSGTDVLSLGRNDLFADVSGFFQYKDLLASGSLSPGLDLDDGSGSPRTDFMFHPNMGEFQRLFNNGNLSVVMGAGGQSNRSHFKAQDATETARPHGSPFGSTHGWFYDIAHSTSLGTADPLFGVGIGPGIPEILVGPESTRTAAIAAINGFALEDTVAEYEQLLANLYDPQAGHESFRVARNAGALTLTAKSKMDALADFSPVSSRWNINNSFHRNLYDAARLVEFSTETRLMSVDTSGWDTHSRQRSRQSGLVAGLNGGLAALVDQLTLSGCLANTCIMIMTEFGRTFDINGNGGTDHGDAGAMYIINGGSNFTGGGKILNSAFDTTDPSRDAWDWPAAANPNLHNWKKNGRFYGPTHTDFRSVYADVMQGFLALSDADIAAVMGLPNFANSNDPDYQEFLKIKGGTPIPSGADEAPGQSGIPGLFSTSS